MRQQIYRVRRQKEELIKVTCNLHAIKANVTITAASATLRPRSAARTVAHDLFWSFRAILGESGRVPSFGSDAGRLAIAEVILASYRANCDTDLCNPKFMSQRPRQR